MKLVENVIVNDVNKVYNNKNYKRNKFLLTSKYYNILKYGIHMPAKGKKTPKSDVHKTSSVICLASSIISLSCLQWYELYAYNT